VDLAAYQTILRRLGVEPADADRPAPSELRHLLNMPLHVFAQEGQPLEVRVAPECWPDTLRLAPDLRHAQGLWREGVARERVWIASELIALLGGAPWTAETLRVVMVTRSEFGGEVIATRRRAVLVTGVEGLPS
jgi:hypothetical protein